MKNQIYGLFSKCFPDLCIGEEIFYRLLDAESCAVITYSEDGVLLGCSVVGGNCIRLLCVRPDRRGNGIGSRLLRESEALIAENGFDRVVLGGRDSGLFIGETVFPEQEQQGMNGTFFSRRGYIAEEDCIEMKMSLSDFDLGGLDIPPCPAGTSFGYIGKDEGDALRHAVGAVDPDWVQYFTFESPVFAAKLDGRIAGFCIIEENADTVISSGSNNVGSAGCVGVVPEMRQKGLGLAMVAEAMQILKADGCTDAFIHYTYLDKWYGRLGLKTFLRYRFSEKKLQSVTE